MRIVGFSSELLLNGFVEQCARRCLAVYLRRAMEVLNVMAGGFALRHGHTA